MLNNYKDSETGRVPVFLDANGNQATVLEFYGLDDSVMSNIGFCFGLLTALLAVFSLCGILALVFIRHEKR